MIHRIKITQDPHRPKDRPQEQRQDILFFPGKPNVFLLHDRQGEKERYKIPEKTLLDRRESSGETHKQIHQRKTKRGYDDTEDSFIFLAHPYLHPLHEQDRKTYSPVLLKLLSLCLFLLVHARPHV